MKLLNTVSLAAGVVLVMAVLPAMKAQTLISDEKLVNTTFEVTTLPKTAHCETSDCVARARMMETFFVTCPGSVAQTCTFHILLDAKVEVISGRAFYQFLIDNDPPNIGPTGSNGGYTILNSSPVTGGTFRLSMPASVVGTVTNSDSQTHKIDINIGCHLRGSPCSITANASTLRVDVFQP
jgi:hypothetical protein